MDNVRSEQNRLLFAGLAVFAGIGLLALALWARYGEAVYFDRLIAGIAGCFG